MNPNSTGNSPRISLRDALLQQITPAEVAEAEANALAFLASHPEQESFDSPGAPPQEDRDSSQPSEYMDDDSPEIERHSRKCTVCHHEQRGEIEQAFLHWVSLRDIAYDFKVSSSDAVRRHAIAMGLDDLRASTMRLSLHRIIENGGNVQPTAAGVIQAIRACSCLDDNGRWVDLPRRVIITHEVRPATQPAAPFDAVLPTPVRPVPQSFRSASHDVRDNRDF